MVSLTALSLQFGLRKTVHQMKTYCRKLIKFRKRFAHFQPSTSKRDYRFKQCLFVLLNYVISYFCRFLSQSYMAVRGIPNCLRCGAGLNFENRWRDRKSQAYGARLKLFIKMSSSILTEFYCFVAIVIRVR